MMNEKTNKVQWIEVLRVVSTVFVLVNHVAIAAIHIFEKSASQWDHFIYNGVNHFSRFAVPCFLMITGILLLNPKRKVDYHKALFKYAWRMIVILLTVGTGFAMMELYFDEKSFSWSMPFVALGNVLMGKTWKHMWYLYALIGLYLVVPVMKAAYEKLDTKSIGIFVLIGFVFVYIFPTLSDMTGYKCGVRFPMVSNFLFYFLIGGWIYKVGSDRLWGSPKVWVMIALLMGLLQFGVSYLEFYSTYSEAQHLKEYSSPLMAFYAFAVFVFIIKSQLWPSSSLGGVILSKFSESSFGIYVFHMLWINVIYKVVKFNPIEHGLWTLIPVLIVVTLLAWATTIAFRKVPYVGKYI